MEEELLVSDGAPRPAAPCNKKSSHLIVRVLLCSLLMGGASFCFLFFSGFFPLFNAGKPEDRVNGRSPREQCDLFSGEWIQDPLGPAYTNESCNFVSDYQNCMLNGRPDTLYLYWRWKPYGCDIPPFNAEKFMDAMRHKSWALIGDSIFRNLVESILCLVSKVEEPVLIYCSEDFQTKTWYFPSHNFTIATIWAPLLVKYEKSADYEGKAEGQIQLHLDALDKIWTSVYHDYDYILISGGQWFTKTMYVWENNTVVGCHGCTDSKELGVGYSYHKALELALRFVATSDHKPFVMFRTWTPSHFEHGEWFSGGICNRTLPFHEGEYNGQPFDRQMRGIEIEEFEKAAAVGSKNRVRMKLLDVFHLSVLRPDGHPGPFRYFYPFAKNKYAKVQNDCLHWCLPGPIDHWSDILMQMLVDEGDLRDTF